MNKKLLQKITARIAITLLFVFAIPSYANAAKIFVDLPEKPISVGNTSIIKVMLDTAEEINAIEGEIKFSTPKDVVSINTGGSIFDLWPRKPSLDINSDKISFVGGTTAGVYGKSLRLFTIAVKPTNTEPIKINLVNATAFLNDGKGTKTAVSGDSIQIPVQISGTNENELVSLTNNDKTPPNKFNIDFGSTPSLFDGKYFISFFTTDNDSGINRYEITEGNRAPVRSGSPYVLQDQSLSSLITVKAIDNAGNERTSTFNPQNSKPWMKIISIIIFILIVFFGFWKFYKNK